MIDAFARGGAQQVFAACREHECPLQIDTDSQVEGTIVDVDP